MKHLRIIFDFIIYWITSTNRHGVHSPFVYGLLENVIYQSKTKYYAYEKIESLRRYLLTRSERLNIVDLGAGSIVKNTKTKTVSEIAGSALKPFKYSQLLFRIANYFSPKNIVELGTSLGITTAYFSAACPSASIHTIEGCPDIADVAATNFIALESSNIKLYKGPFSEHFEAILKDIKKVDMVYFDGDHKKESTLGYFNQCLPYVHNNSVLIFDDIYWSKGMKDAWQEICNHPEVTLTIDLFQIGLVFFRKEQPKEHFKIRF